jgi:hypothetical protein
MTLYGMIDMANDDRYARNHFNIKPVLESVNRVPSKSLVKQFFGESNGFGEYTSIAVELLRKTVEILDAFGIDYFLISGTLLGMVRHGGFIPWDDDIDLIVDCSILDKLGSIVESCKDNVCVLNNADHTVKFCFTNHGIEVSGGLSDKLEPGVLSEGGVYKWPFVDLFIYRSSDDGHINFFCRDWEVGKFTPHQIVDFRGVDVRVPSVPKYFLESNYGPNYMTVFKSNSYSHRKEDKLAVDITIDKRLYDAYMR